MPRRAKYAGDEKTRNKYRQRVHNWVKAGLTEGKDFILENGVPIRQRVNGRLPPQSKGRPPAANDTPKDAPTDKELTGMPAINIMKLRYGDSVKIALLRRKWDLDDATGHTTTHPIQSMPPLPSYIQEEIRDLADNIAAIHTRDHPHPYGSRDNGD